MTWVYPEAEAATTTRLAVSAGAFWASVMLVVGGTSTLIVDSVISERATPYYGISAFLGLALLLILARIWPQPRLAVAIALVVTATVFVGMLGHQITSSPGTPAFPLRAAMLITVALGGIADRRSGAIGTLVGYALAQGILLVTAPTVPIDFIPPIVAVFGALFYGFLDLTRAQARAAASSLNEAVRADLLLAQRRAYESRSRALVHDTVLSELVALGVTPPGPLSEATRASIAQSLATVRGPSDAAGFAARPSLALGSILERESRAGLDVEVTGDPGAIDALPDGPRAAILQAIDQALVNVRKHAGVSEAELSVIESGPSIVATVVDEGVGFVEADIPLDRFGFRESIRGSLESVGGGARILSSPGAGTSIILTVPREVTG